MATLTVNTTLGDGSVTRAKLNDALVVTEAEGIAANDNDNTIPTTAAVKDYVDDQGYVVGPAGSTNNNVPQWDGTTGKLLKDGLGVSQGANGAADSQKLAQYTSTGKLQAGVDNGDGIQGISVNDDGVHGTSQFGSALYGNVTGAGARALRLTHAGGSGEFIRCWNGGADQQFVVDYDGAISWPNGGTGPQTTATNLPAFGSSTKGVVPASGGGTSNFLRADGTWAAPPSGGITDGSALSIGLQFPQAGLTIADQNGDHTLVIVPDENFTANRQLSIQLDDANKTIRLTGDLRTLGNAEVLGTNTGDQTITLTGDVTGTGTGSFAATIANDAVTNAKAANMAQATVKGRAAAAGTGDPTDLTADQVSTILDGATDPFQRASRELTASLSSDFTTSSASYVDVTGLAVTLAANSRYMVLIDGAYQSANTGTGAMVSITRTGSPTVCNFERRLYTAAATNSMLGSVGNADDVGSPGTTVDSANTDRHWNMFGSVVTGASSCTIQVRAIRGGAANNITIRAGSSIVAHKVS